MLHWFKNKAEDFFSIKDKQIIVAAIKKAETMTSGEVRVFIESKCSYVQAIDRAIELFDKLDMHKTEDRNGVLVYVALKHRQLAIYADEGIYQKVGTNYWKNQLHNMIQHFRKDDYAQGIANVVLEIGEALKQHFPYDDRGDVNELNDDIVFGN